MEGRQRVELVPSAESFFAPLATTLITATSSGAAHTLGTVRATSTGFVRRLFVGNQTGSAAALTVHFIPEGGTIGAGNREITALSVAANSNVDLTDLIGGMYGPGTEIKAFAGTGSALIVGGYLESAL